MKFDKTFKTSLVDRSKKTKLLWVGELGFAIAENSMVYPIVTINNLVELDWENGTLYADCTDEFKENIPLEILRLIKDFLVAPTMYNYDSITVKRFDDEREYFMTIMLCYENDNIWSNTEQEVFEKISEEVRDSEAKVVTINERQFVSPTHPIELGFVAVKPYETVYEMIQHYGGAEEGGWFYHTKVATDIDHTSVELGLDNHGEGLIMETEVIQGMLENTEKQIYC